MRATNFKRVKMPPRHLNTVMAFIGCLKSRDREQILHLSLHTCSLPKLSQSVAQKQFNTSVIKPKKPHKNHASSPGCHIRQTLDGRLSSSLSNSSTNTNKGKPCEAYLGRLNKSRQMLFVRNELYCMNCLAALSHPNGLLH